MPDKHQADFLDSDRSHLPAKPEQSRHKERWEQHKQQRHEVLSESRSQAEADTEALLEEARHIEVKPWLKYGNHILTIVVTVAMVFLAVYAWQRGLFTSVEALQRVIKRLGIFGPILFVLLQIIQVVVPIIPGGVTLGAGVLIFGNLFGFIYNYIGIVLGSFIIFLLMRSFGRPLAYRLIGRDKILKYGPWLNDQRRFGRLFALAIFLPLAPDDALCYLAGLSSMSWRRYATIILLGKPFAVLLYSLGLTKIFTHIAQFQQNLH